MTRSERVNGWRLNPNITQALIIIFLQKNNTPYTQHLSTVIYGYLVVEKGLAYDHESPAVWEEVSE